MTLALREDVLARNILYFLAASVGVCGIGWLLGIVWTLVLAGNPGRSGLYAGTALACLMGILFLAIFSWFILLLAQIRDAVTKRM